MSPVRNREEVSLDLTGSPLKDECPIEALDISANLRDNKREKSWESAEEEYQGVDLEAIIKIFNSLNYNIASESGISIWALSQRDSKNALILQKEFLHGWNSRGKIWSDGQLLLEDVNLAALRTVHLSFVGGIEKVEMDISSHYKLASNIMLEFNCINTNQTTLMNTTNSVCTLRQELPVDSKDFLAEQYWRQLIILDMIAKEIAKYKMHDDKRIDPVYDCGSNIATIESLRDEIRVTLTELPLNMTNLKTTASQNTVSSVLGNTHERDCLSITDKLWDILKMSASYRDLKMAFNFIFHSACENKILNVETSGNHLAMLIDSLAHKEVSIPCLVGSEPLELLLEIGLEKARKDYEYVFSNSKVCFPEELQLQFQGEATLEENQPYSKRLTSRKSLLGGGNQAKSSRATSAKSLLKNPTGQDAIDDNMVGFRNSHFNRGEVEYRLAKLAQVHFVLEHLLIAEGLKLTNLNQLITRSLLDAPLVAMKDLNSAEHYTLNISVPNDQVVGLTKLQRPNSLRIVMRSMNKFRQVENTFYYTSEAIIPPETFPMNAENLSEVDDDIDKDLYLVHRYLKIRTLNRNGVK
ncbi:protein zwilch [Phlebotomus argentipes]|uniref:protein zwilch n=1 Tax=Phlebotomus argentipes TaxID=94469 RepID=UPI0028934C34|nr:protein zwilch [Phlebotomus argentipes]